MDDEVSNDLIIKHMPWLAPAFESLTLGFTIKINANKVQGRASTRKYA